MSRNSILAIIALVALVVGLPAGIVALKGGDDETEPRPGAEGQRVEPEGLYSSGAPEEERQQANGDGDARRNEKPRGGGGPPRAYPTSDNVAYPNDVTASGGHVARVLERHLGAIAPKADQLTVLGADCRGGVCSARYVSGPHGGGRIINDAAVIVRRLFARRSVQTVRLFVHEPRGRRSKQAEPMALMVVTCRRAANPRLGWTRLTPRKLAQQCTVIEQSPGKLGAQIRRGLLSEEAASKGKAGSSGGQGGSGDGAPGLDPPGTPAPENVNPKRPKGGDRGSGNGDEQDAERDGG